MAKIIPDRFAAMTVDPGNVTGVAQGVFRTDRGDDMLESVIRRAVKKKQFVTWEVRGEHWEQAWTICNHYSAFRFKCNVEYGIDLKDIHLIIESFHLRHAQADLKPVEVVAGINTLLCKPLDPPNADALSMAWPLGIPEVQEPSTAKHLNNAHLKRLGIYVVGSTHRRDVARHLAQFVSRVL